VSLDIALLSERWLRHKGVLLENRGFFDKFCSAVSIFFSIVGAVGLILLSIFDTFRHHPLHDAFLAVFM
jgi:Frag1/DRAM/Sfk1 family